MLEVVEFNYGSAARINITIQQNRWHHIVAQNNGSANRAWLDGADVATETGDNPSVDGTFFIGESATGGNFFDGYLSDFYFVPQAHNADRFGLFYSGKWGPRDSQYVLESIGF